MIFDTHAHFDDERFNEDRDELFENMQNSGVAGIVNVGATLQGCYDSVDLSMKYPFVYSAVGIHPNEVLILEENEDNFSRLKEMAVKEKVVAIGEIGLDYYWDEPDREIQKKWFRRQIGLAKELGKPINVHSRDAAADTLSIIKQEEAKKVGGIIHCFSYGVEIAREYIDLGFYLGIGGVVTFKNSKKLKEVVDFLPTDRIVVETDSPYLSPEPFRGTRNNSEKIRYVLESIAQIKGLTYEEIEEITYDNALRVYGI